MEVFLFALLAMIVGLGLTFGGYVAFRVLLPFIAFLAGFWLGLDVVSNFATNFPIMGISLGLILGLLFGGVLAAISYFVYSFAVLIAGMAMGYALGAGFMLALGLNGILTFVVGIIGAVSLGLLFYVGNMPKVYVVVVTAAAGASALIAGVLALFGKIPPSQLGLSMIQPYIVGQSFFWTVVWIVLVFAGIVSQLWMSNQSESMIPEAYSYDETIEEYEKKAKAETKEKSKE